MDYLSSDKWDEIKNRLKDKFIFLFLDYDGTLTPIVETPDKAVISQEAKELLKKLSKNHDCKIAIISGRSLNDVKNIAGIKDIIYVGNHGLEVEGPKIRFKSSVSPGLKRILRHINNELYGKLSKMRGVFIEDKGLTLSIHYRLVDRKDISLVNNIFTETTQPYILQNKIRISCGKKVYEIRPPVEWDKGKVVLWLLARQQFANGIDKVLPIYIGDDVTDEDAFKAVKNKGLTVFVGKPKKSYAQYYLKNTSEVMQFLRQLMELKKDTTICQN